MKSSSNNILLLSLSLLTTLPSFISAFGIHQTQLLLQPHNTLSKSHVTPLHMLPPDTASVTDILSSNSFLMTKELDQQDFGELTKTLVIVLAFGGGLIPATIAANKAMINTLSGKTRRIDSSNQNPSTSLDPTAGQTSQYITSSGATGPNLPLQSLLFSTEDIPLSDIVAIIGRIENLDSVADWKNLPSTKLPNLANPSNPPMYLPRNTFKANIRKSPYKGTSWPIDPKTNEPVGGSDLASTEFSRIKSKNVEIGDAALDAVYDTWAWGASVATPDKVQSQLQSWRPNRDSFDLNEFVGAAVRGRAVTGFAALTFVVIQIIAYGTLFVGPALRQFFDIDVGFGVMGECGVDGCLKLF